MVWLTLILVWWTTERYPVLEGERIDIWVALAPRTRNQASQSVNKGRQESLKERLNQAKCFTVRLALHLLSGHAFPALGYYQAMY